MDAPTHILKPEECVVFWGMGSVCSNFHGAEYSRLEEFPKDPNNAKFVLFKSVEHDYMYHKATYFKDYFHAEKIRTAKEPKDAKRWGRKVRWYDDAKWNKVKEAVMFRAKLAQAHEWAYIRNYYLRMKGRTFIEASPYDAIWGVKLGADDPAVYNRRKWKGKNLLGKVCGKLAAHLVAEIDERAVNKWMESQEIVMKLHALCTNHSLPPHQFCVDGLSALVLSNVYSAANRIDLSVTEAHYKVLRAYLLQGQIRGYDIQNPQDRCLELLDYGVYVKARGDVVLDGVVGVPSIRDKWAAFSWVSTNPVLFGVLPHKLVEIAQYMNSMDEKK